jgi:myo-inositol-1(or 4)-monophosphatase
MPMITPKSFVDFVLPALVHAGRYAARIQQSVKPRESKKGRTVFQQALSDADLSVQGFMEVLLLSRFPEISFFSEEQDQSLNLKYFAQNAEYEILLDPIDGTRSYLDGEESFQIIVTLHDRNAIAAAVCHLPRRELCYVAIRGEPAVAYTVAEMELGTAPTRKIELSAASRRIVVFDEPRLQTLLRGEFDVVDVFENYQMKRKGQSFTGIFDGSIAGFIHSSPQVIDAGAMAFIAEQAGAVVTDFRGSPLGSFRTKTNRRLDGVIVGASQEIHRQIMTALEAK